MAKEGNASAGFAEAGEATTVKPWSFTWAQGEQGIYYACDENGSVIEKITAIKDEPALQTDFEEKITSNIFTTRMLSSNIKLWIFY